MNRTAGIQISVLLLALIPAGATAQETGTSLNDWLEEKIQGIIELNVDLRGESRQPETPSQTANSTTLVDRGSSALVGMALNLAGLPTDSEDEDESAAAITLNAYSLFAALRGVDPLNPTFYRENAAWRRLSFTAGYDDEAADDGSTQKVQLIGAKWLIVDKRQPGAQSKRFTEMRQLITESAVAYADLNSRIKSHILEHLLSQSEFRDQMNREYEIFLRAKGAPGDPTSEKLEIGPDHRVVGDDPLAREFFSDFRDSLFGTGFRDTLERLGPDIERQLEEIVESDVEASSSFVRLEQQTQKKLEEIRSAPQFSFSALSKRRPEGVDDYTGQLIFEAGLGSRVNFVANGSVEYKDNKSEDEDIHNERIALQLDFQMGQEQIVGRSPFRFSLAAEGKRMSEEDDDTWKAQAKLTIPLMDGVEFPVSVTFASDTALIEEKEVRGNFGFTLDVARLVDALKPTGE